MPIAEILSNPVSGIMFIVGIVLAVTVHEFSHAKMADHLGDPTPSMQGRVTLNPKAHLDLMGSLLFLIIGFGWGKPVVYDPYNLENPRRDAALIALAGPGSNAVFALLCSGLLYLSTFVDQDGVLVIGRALLMHTIFANVALGVFNLLPIAPLDGFKIVGGALSDERAREWYGLERYGFIFLMMMIFPLVGGRSVLDIVVSPVVSGVLGVLMP